MTRWSRGLVCGGGVSGQTGAGQEQGQGQGQRLGFGRHDLQSGQVIVFGGAAVCGAAESARWL